MTKSVVSKFLIPKITAHLGGTTFHLTWTIVVSNTSKVGYESSTSSRIKEIGHFEDFSVIRHKGPASGVIQHNRPASCVNWIWSSGSILGDKVFEMISLSLGWTHSWFSFTFTLIFVTTAIIISECYAIFLILWRVNAVWFKTFNLAHGNIPFFAKVGGTTIPWSVDGIRSYFLTCSVEWFWRTDGVRAEIYVSVGLGSDRT